MNALFDSDVDEVAQETAIELRILHGGQAGSRLSLAPGEYLIGCGDSCTLMLNGNGIEDQHAVLRFDGEAAWIEPVEGLVRNAHGDDIEDELELALGLPIELGSVWICVDREDAPWPDSHSVTPMHTRQLGEVEDTTVDLLLNESDDDSDEVVAAVENTFTPPEKRSLVRLYIGIFLFLLVLGGAGTAYLMRATEAEQAPALPAATRIPEAPPAEAVAILKGYADLQLSLSKTNDSWIVTGFVATTAQRDALSAALAGVLPAVLAKVTVQEVLLQEAKRLLANSGPAAQVKAESGADGVIRLTGAAASGADIDQIRQTLLSGVPGIRDVTSEILVPDQLRKQLRDRLAAAGLADRLVVTNQGPELNLSGRLTMDEIRRWEELLLGFNRDYGNVLPIRAMVTRLIPKPPVGVQAIVGGAVPYIVTPSGAHINQGGDVNGHTLVSVKDGEVIFEGRQRIRIAR